MSDSSNSHLIPVAQIAPRFFVLSLLFLCFASGFSLVIRAQKPTFSRHSFVAVSLPLLGFGSRARCRVAPLFSVSNFPNSAADNQGTNTSIDVFVSLLFLCFCLACLSRLCFVSVSSLSRLSLVFRARKVKFCEVLKTDLFFSFSNARSFFFFRSNPRFSQVSYFFPINRQSDRQTAAPNVWNFPRTDTREPLRILLFVTVSASFKQSAKTTKPGTSPGSITNLHCPSRLTRF